MDTKKYDIILTDIAKIDLDEIYEYIFKNLKEPDIAENLIEQIKKNILDLEIFPYRWREVYVKPKNRLYRRLIVENFIVLYRVVEEKRHVVIFRVLYSKRDYLEF